MTAGSTGVDGAILAILECDEPFRELDGLPPRVRSASLDVPRAPDQVLAGLKGRDRELGAQLPGILAGLERGEEAAPELTSVHAWTTSGVNSA